MYKGFNLAFNTSSTFKELLNKYHDYGKEIYNNKKNEVIKNLDSYLGPDGSLDCSALQEDWFPTINSNIFISHSHDDEELAVSLAGWLYKKFKLTSFIDSYVWGYCNDLLKDIDEEYCKHSNGQSYDYDKRNYSTSHVHMMLSTALTKMIDKTECILFLNTDKSTLKAKDIISTQTRSPWIYSEIMSTKMLRKNTPKRFTLKKSTNGIQFIENAQKTFKPTYDIDLKHLVKLSESNLNNLHKCYETSYPNNPTDALDKLYQITHIH
ncbi:hypothetical protein [Clostridium weizhouense]|uniref:TIR domain-containing protein n=1 Tax=Clostridium weizhouense TaxID=2859781 RepID=A0ABS7ASP1_9CLOT|nr:hypothetical protein [Clostridium weizhouense]MBW6411674.1 hypothetical protein [Clostridium weizhouense]